MNQFNVTEFLNILNEKKHSWHICHQKSGNCTEEIDKSSSYEQKRHC